MTEGLAEHYDERIAGVLCCYDRIVITGTVPGICHAQGMTAFLRANAVTPIPSSTRGFPE